MGNLAPPSASSSASLLLPSLTPAVDDWFIRSTSDDLLTQALTHELRSASNSCSSSSGPSLEPSTASALRSNYSDGLLHPRSQSNLSQVGSPFSSDSISKDQPESPFNYLHGSSVFGMSTVAMSSQDAFKDSCITQHYQAPQAAGRHNKTPLQAPSTALSAQAAAGAGASKVSKRRARTSKKVPIAVLSADTSNFRAMVQQLTGIPTPQTLPHLWGGHGVPLLKPQPTRISPLDLPTLDTSSSFLAPKMNPFLQPGHQALSGLLAPEFSHLQGKGKPSFGSSYFPSIINYDALLASSPLDILVNANLNGNCAKGNVKHESASNMEYGREHHIAVPTSTSLESFLMGDEDQYSKVSHNSVDSWLAIEGGAVANHSPKLAS